MIACMCAWCGCFVLEEETYEIVMHDEESGEITGYELACGCCFEFLLKTLLETCV